jgi:5'-3' exonuclease
MCKRISRSNRLELEKNVSLVVVDLATIYYRAFYSLPDTFVAPNGLPVNAVRGTLDALMHFSKQYKPSNLITCWDFDWRPQWRVDLIDTYKTARVASEDEEQMPDSLGEQVDLIWEILNELGIPAVGLDGFESDDLVAHFSKTGPTPTFIVSGDRDLFQLIDDDLGRTVLYIGTGIAKHTIADNKYIFNRFGILPHQYVDYSVMRGDASDGLPGVKGIGEKTATNLLKEFADMKQILAAAKTSHTSIKPRIAASLLEHKDYIKSADKVVRLDRKLKVETPFIDWENLGHSQTLDNLGLEKYNGLWKKTAAKVVS